MPYALIYRYMDMPKDGIEAIDTLNLEAHRRIDRHEAAAPYATTWTASSTYPYAVPCTYALCNIIYALLYMHYAHRSSFYLYSSSCIIHCLQKHIQAKGNGHRPDGSHRGFTVRSDRLQSKAPAKSPCVNCPQLRHIGQMPSQQYTMPSSAQNRRYGNPYARAYELRH